MTREEISQAIGDIREEYVEEAAQQPTRRKKHSRQGIRLILGAAACMAVAVAAQGLWERGILQNETTVGAASHSCAQPAEKAPAEGTAENGTGEQAASVLRVRIETRRDTGFTAAVLSETEPFRAGDVVEITIREAGADKQEDTARAVIYAQYPQVLDKAAEGDIIDIMLSSNGNKERMLCIRLKKDE